jgi:Cu(I)/Ag(I) efflux system membrane fusion protein
VELEQLKRDGEPKRMITLRSPVSGVVVEKPATRGMRFMPGEALYQISDLSALWLLADIFEQDLGLVRPGQAARITVNAFPGRTFDGRVAFLYPTVTAETRTGRVRIDLPNTGGLLKPSMYASVELSASGTSGKALAIPDSAVLDSGSSQAVLIRRGEGLFEPRRVKLGTRAEGYVELLDGVGEGEQVVVRANFLIDAESNLKAALGGFASPGGAPDAAATASAAGIHRGKGSVGEVDVGRQKITIDHGPIPSLKWPAMRMEFDVKDKAMLRGIKPGQAVEFGLVQRAPGEFAIESINVPGTPSQKPPADHGSAHKGH